MYCYRSIIFYSIVILCILCQFSVTGGHAATTKATTKAPTRITPAKTNGTKSTDIFPARTGGKIITLRLGADGTSEEQCECRLFYLCAQDNTIDTSLNGQNCDDNYVCCKIDSFTQTESSVITMSTDPISVDPPSSPSTGTTGSTGNCQCVPADQCRRTREQEMSGAGAIDERITPCRMSEICCSLQNIMTSSPIEPTVPTSPPYSDSNCGIRNSGQEISNRIVSPEHLKNTSFGEFPWMALLLTAEIDPNTQQRLDNVFICGASLISSKIVLTAGHCVHDVTDISLLKVRVGEYDTRAEANKEQKPHQDRQVSKITKHSNFNPKSLYNDLALIEVAEPFEFDYHVKPICIPLISNTYDYDPSNCVATGWGKNAFGPESQYPTTLKKVDLTIIPNERCQEELRKTRLGQFFILDASFICAGGQAGMDTCEGDGGGPLVCPLRNEPNRYVQVGIVSWGIGCANGIPAAYASLERNLEWLTQEFNAATVFGSSSVGERRKSS